MKSVWWLAWQYEYAFKRKSCGRGWVTINVEDKVLAKIPILSIFTCVKIIADSCETLQGARKYYFLFLSICDCNPTSLQTSLLYDNPLHCAASYTVEGSWRRSDFSPEFWCLSFLPVTPPTPLNCSHIWSSPQTCILKPQRSPIKGGHTHMCIQVLLCVNVVHRYFFQTP